MNTLPRFCVCSVNGMNRKVVTGHHSCTKLRSCLAPPFVRDDIHAVCHRLARTIGACGGLLPTSKRTMLSAKGGSTLGHTSLTMGGLAIGLNVRHRLRLSDLLAIPCTRRSVRHVRGFTRRLTGRGVANRLCAVKVPCRPVHVASDICTVTARPVTCDLLTLSGLHGHTSKRMRGRHALFARHCLRPTHSLIAHLLTSPSLTSSRLVYHVANVASSRLTGTRRVGGSHGAPRNVVAVVVTLTRRTPTRTGARTSVDDKVVRTSRDKYSGEGDVSKSVGRGVGRVTGNVGPRGTVRLTGGVNTDPRTLGGVRAKVCGDHTMNVGALTGSAIAVGAASQKGHRGTSDSGFKNVRTVVGTVVSGGGRCSGRRVGFTLTIIRMRHALGGINGCGDTLLRDPRERLASVIGTLGKKCARPSPNNSPVTGPGALPAKQGLFTVGTRRAPSRST